MYDDLGRRIEYVRISVTDLCNLRCRYCMPEAGIPKLRHEDILSYEEILRLVHCFARLGAKKIRLTGGEPLIREGLLDLIHRLKAVPGIEKVVLTTNGVLLPQMADKLKAAGLDYINVSLDTLDAATFFRLTRRQDLTAVKKGLQALKDAGFKHTRINCIPLRGINETDIPRLAEFARDEEINVRFIALMPVGCAYEAGLERIPMAEVKNILQTAFGPLEKTAARESFWGPAEYVQPPGFTGKIGFIDAMEHKFCASCNRLRLTAEGFLKLCLHSSQGLDLRSLLRSGITDDALCQAIAAAVRKKPAEHQFAAAHPNTRDKRYMYQVGG
ncbi:MAG: GTP 3',8-cyclase MoaA [Selenomonas sp.]|uniref:GTP 3',8-cyclase MoaA n=1 Tax=Selenomonas sp. TaxID=2053611 RepID=UPI0025CCA7CE|nr:GTP 3',8-cyclase MoaA [Selenomonas sp.]MCR5756976.1 GTP 3',8-cyclase MoaA [Selenomonas sp.]